MCFTGQKLKLIFTLPSKLLTFIIDRAKSCFFFHPLPTFSLQQLTKGFQLVLREPENSILSPKLVFPSK